MEDPDEVLLPTKNRILIVLLVDESRGHIPFSLLDGLLLDRGHGSAIGTLLSDTLGVHSPDPTHVVN